MRYRFDDVVIELQGRRVFVGGRERSASRRAFDLLQILCEQPGRLLTRDELSDRLWPGGQIVSDEALTQAIFRARAVLGPPGERIVTVRGLGIRFDASVEREIDGGALPRTWSGRTAANADGDDASSLDNGTSRLPPAPAHEVASTGAEASPVSLDDRSHHATMPSSSRAPTDAGVEALSARSEGTQRRAHAQTLAFTQASTTPAAHGRAADTPTVAVSATGSVGQPLRDVSNPRADAASPATRFRTRWLLVVALALLATLAFWFWPQREPAPIDVGYGITEADVHAQQPDSARLLGEALAHDNGGDRARARALLEALHESDAHTPWPALLLGLWATGGDTRSTDAWLTLVRERAAPLHDRYVNAMLRYVEAERSGTPQDVVRHAGVVLDLRPGAWRMQLARAHLMNYQGMRDAALAEIRGIRVEALGNRKLEMALADRASFGDVAGSQAVLDKLPRTTDTAAWEYLAGRIAWSRGDAIAARAAWERAAAEARKNGRNDIANRAAAFAGLVAMLAGDRASAIAHFERARVVANETGEIGDEVDLSLLLTQLYALDGNADVARAEFDRAVAVAAPGSSLLMAMQATLVGTRLFPAYEVELPTDPRAAAQALLAARRARARGDDKIAQRELATAQQRGILELGYADEARLLAAELGMPVGTEKPLDPPHPPLSAAAARLFLALAATRPRPERPIESPSTH